MSSQNNEKMLELYNNRISIEALQNAEKFLESSLPLSKGVEHRRFLEKSSYEAQQIEYNKGLAASLHNELHESGHKIVENAETLRTLEELQKERDELKKKRETEDEDVPKSYERIENLEKTLVENDDLRKKLRIMMKEVEEKALNYTC